MSWRPILLALECLLLPVAAVAQRAAPATPLRYEASTMATPATPPRLPSAATSVVASALLPGAGQFLEGQRRWVPYLALEVWSWLRFRERRHEARDLVDRYRDLAWQVARRVCACERRDSVFEYYEALAQYGSSGLWDASPSQAGLQPESDANTYNGQLWALARGLYFPGGDEREPGTPEYEAALSYYRALAIPEDYVWAWGGNNLEQQVFANLITDSDDAYRAGTRMLGLIIANHVASAVDALITARLRSLASGRAEFRSGLAPEPTGTRLQTQVRISF